MVNGTLLDIVECLDPLCRVDGDILLQEAVENILDIADQWDRRSKVFADLSGIDIDVDDVDLLFQVFRLRNGAVCDPCARDDQKVTVCDRAVCVRFSVVSEHTEVERVVLRHDTDSHHRCDKRDIVFLAELADTFLTISEDHAAAGTDQRLFRLVDRCDYFMHLRVVSLCARLVSADIDLGRIVEGFL